MPKAVARSSACCRWWRSRAAFGHSVASLPFGVYGGIAASSSEVASSAGGRGHPLGAASRAPSTWSSATWSRATDWPRQDLYVTFRKEILPEKRPICWPSRASSGPWCARAEERLVATSMPMSIASSRSTPTTSTATAPRPCPKRFCGAAQEFGPDAEVLTVCGPDGRLLSPVLTFYFRDECLPYYAGDDEAARDLASQRLQILGLMRRACARPGSRSFDYGAASGHRPVQPSRRTGASSPSRCPTSTCSSSATASPEQSEQPQVPVADQDLAPPAACRRQLAWPPHRQEPRMKVQMKVFARPPPALPAQQGRQGALHHLLRTWRGSTRSTLAPLWTTRTTGSTCPKCVALRGRARGRPHDLARPSSPACAAC